MPAHNAEKTIAGAINSILTQTYENWELIIVNDGSEDKTEEVIQQFRDKRIKVLNRGHRGLVFSRNLGNKKARGSYCIVQDADDYSLPDRIEKCLRKIGGNDVIVHGAYVNALNTQYGCPERRYVSPKIGITNCLKNKINGWPMYRREVWVKKPFRMETQFSYDWMMHLDWTLSGFKYTMIDEGLYDYIRYQGSASDRFERSGQRAKAFEIIKEIVKREYGETTRYGSDGLIQETEATK